MTQLSKTDVLTILKTTELKTEEVFIPSWNGSVIITELTARQKLSLGMVMVADNNGTVDLMASPEMMLRAAGYGLRLPEARWDELDNHPEAVMLITEAVLELSGMSDSAEETAKKK